MDSFGNVQGFMLGNGQAINFNPDNPENRYFGRAVRTGDSVTVPEPGSVALLGVGLVVLRWARRCKA